MEKPVEAAAEVQKSETLAVEIPSNEESIVYSTISKNMAEVNASEMDSSVGVDMSSFPQTNWVKAISDNGKAYYYDSATKESAWKIPMVFVQLKDGEMRRYKWLEMKNKDEGSMKKYPVYYYDRESKETKWDKPAELLEFERRLDEVISNQLLKKKKRRVETEKRV